LEDHLARFTLSPELEKLYAHPSELITISTSHSGEYIASACKASTPENALIRIFNSSYTQIATLPGHNLTVTKISWNQNDSFLVSVGRDRQWIIFDTKTWKPRKIMAKAHARIIWDVDISPMESCVFCTVSRDKTLKIWTFEGDCVDTLKFDEGVMACAFLPFVFEGMGIVAVGLENGAIYIVGGVDGRWRVLTCFDDGYGFCWMGLIIGLRMLRLLMGWLGDLDGMGGCGNLLLVVMIAL
jgi:WD40 repeat protein